MSSIPDGSPSFLSGTLQEPDLLVYSPFILCRYQKYKIWKNPSQCIRLISERLTCLALNSHLSHSTSPLIVYYSKTSSKQKGGTKHESQKDTPGGKRRKLSKGSQHLEAEGYLVVIALEVPGAFDLVRREKPDVLILDFHMAVSDEPSLLERICSLPETKSIPTLILYTHVEEEMVDSLFKYGLRHLLRKPYGLDELSLQVALILKAKEEETSEDMK